MFKKNKNRMKGTIIDNIQLLILQAPTLILFFIFCYVPMYGIIIAFKQFNPMKGIWGSPWSGLKNFEFFFQSDDSFRVIRNTLAYNIVFLILGTICTVAIALFLYNLTRRTLVKLYNTIMILPKFMSMVLIAYIVYALLNPASGVVNQMLESFGMDAVDWYSKLSAWPFIITYVYLWSSVGWGSIIYYAALMGINPELFEAAEIDGASKLQQTMHIAVPEIMSLVVIQTILYFGHMFSGDFGLFYQIPRNVSTLYPTTDIINTYTFRLLTTGDMSKSAAVGLMQSVVGIILIVSVNMIVKKISPEDSLF